MRSMSRTVLAIDAAWKLDAGACRGLGRFWSQHESRHGAAPNGQVAAEAAAPLLEVCATCPVLNLCEQWAQIDQYTGIAAGTAWVNGARKPPHWVRRQAPRKQAG